MVHRPGLEHTRLTPSNAEELLFDDVLWVSRAKAEHDMFREVMQERGVEVFEAEQLLAEALALPEAREWVCSHILNERQVGVNASLAAREWVGTADAATVADFLIGGITRADVRRDAGLMWQMADPTTILLPPLPNFLFQRDCSCWIFNGVTINPMTKPARQPETMIMETIYRFHPMFAAEEFPVWLGGADEQWGRCHVEGGDVQPIGNGTVMIGMGERTTPQAVTWIARSLFRADAARQVLAVYLPKSRSYMHLDTVITMCDRDLVTLHPGVVYGARAMARISFRRMPADGVWKFTREWVTKPAYGRSSIGGRVVSGRAGARRRPHAIAHWLGVQIWRIKFTFPGRRQIRPVSRPAGKARRSSG